MRLCVSALRASIAVLSAAAPRETAFEEFPALRITVFSAVFLGVFLETCFCAVRVFAAIVDGQCDDLPEWAFFNVGTLADARKKYADKQAEEKGGAN